MKQSVNKMKVSNSVEIVTFLVTHLQTINSSGEMLNDWYKKRSETGLNQFISILRPHGMHDGLVKVIYGDKWSRKTLSKQLKIFLLHNASYVCKSWLNYLDVKVPRVFWSSDMRMCQIDMTTNGQDLIFVIIINTGQWCDSVGRAGASDTRGPQFESGHRQLFIKQYLFLTVCRKDENKEKEAGVTRF